MCMNCTKLGEKNMSWWPVFLVEAVAIVILNAITIATIVSTSALRRRHNYLLVSIAVADFLVGAVSVALFTAVLGGICCGQNFTHNWWAAQDTFFAIASMFGLAALSFERVCAISWPLGFQNTKVPVYAIFIVVPWLFALVSAISHALMKRENQAAFYLSVALVVASLIIIFASNVVIWIKAKAGSLRQDVVLERNLAITVSVVVMVSLMAWLPFVICNIIIVECRCLTEIMMHALPVTKMLHYGNSLVNPIIYVIRIKDFRRAALNLLTRKKGSETLPKEDMSLATLS